MTFVVSHFDINLLVPVLLLASAMIVLFALNRLFRK